MDDIQPLIRQLAAEIDQLETAVTPLLMRSDKDKTTKITKTTTTAATLALRLPLLDKAKLHVLSAFAIESTLYCSLGLAGVDPRRHAVYRELQRVRNYMGKIDNAEKAPAIAQQQQQQHKLDKSAAIRFLKADMDSPVVKAQMDQLLREERATAEANRRENGDGNRESDCDGDDSSDPKAMPGRANDKHVSHSRKRSGVSGAGTIRTNDKHLDKRPKHGDGSRKSSNKGRSHSSRTS